MLKSSESLFSVPVGSFTTLDDAQGQSGKSEIRVLKPNQTMLIAD
jgi:hypothetical protein